MSIFDHAIVSQRYFFPRADAPSKIHWIETRNAKLACRYAPLHDDAPLVVHFHGNGEVVADYEDQIPFFHQAGMSVLFFEFRGYGSSTGEPALAGMLEDVADLSSHLPVSPSRTVAFGRSVGSIYAIEYAARFPELAGLVLESAVASPLERVLMRVAPGELSTTKGALESEAERILDHERKMKSVTCPTLLLHTHHDSLVLYENAERLFKWSGSDDKKLVGFERGDHNDILYQNQTEYLSECSAFFSRVTR